MPTILYSSFSILPSFSFLAFLLLFFLSVYLFFYDSLLEVAIIVFVIVMVIPPLHLCTVKVPYIVPAVTGFYHFSI